MTLSAEETEVWFILKKYRAQKHYRASSDAKVTRYAVFRNSEQVTEPKSFSEAAADRDRLIASEVVRCLKASLTKPDAA
jgi:hypothetical protein